MAQDIALCHYKREFKGRGRKTEKGRKVRNRERNEREVFLFLADLTRFLNWFFSVQLPGLGLFPLFSPVRRNKDVTVFD